MIAVTLEDSGNFTIELSPPDLIWLTEAAKGFGMDTPTILASCISKGLEHYHGVLNEIADHEKRKRGGG